jgi:hypothetical protein
MGEWWRPVASPRPLTGMGEWQRPLAGMGEWWWPLAGMGERWQPQHRPIS